MFIDAGSMVTVKDDATRRDLAGRYGKVLKIRIAAQSGAVCVFVELFNRHTGAFDVHLVEPADIRPRHLEKTTAKRVERDRRMEAVIFDELAAE